MISKVQTTHDKLDLKKMKSFGVNILPREAMNSVGEENGKITYLTRK